MAFATRESEAEPLPQGFRIWARHSPKLYGSGTKAIGLTATAIDLPPTMALPRNGLRLVLVEGVLAGPQGRTEFVAARLIERRPEGGHWDEGRGFQNPTFTGRAHMTDKELSEFGGKLYEAVLFTPLPAATVFSLALAVRQAIPWSHLPQHLKFAVFKIAASCTGQVVVDASSTSASEPTPASAQSTHGDSSHGALGDDADFVPPAREAEASVPQQSSPAGDGEASAA